jgi:hypothetical protein
MKLSQPMVESNRSNATVNLQHFKSNLAKTLNSNWLKKFDKTKPSISSAIDDCLDLDTGSRTKSTNPRMKTKKKEPPKKKHVCSTPCIPVKLSHNNYKNTRKESSICDLVTDNFLNEINLDSDFSERSKSEPDNCLVQKVFYNSCVSIFNTFEPGNLDSQFMYEPSGSNSANVDTSGSKFTSSHLEDKVSNDSSTVSLFAFSNSDQSDSGLSSLNSAQLFFSEIREFIVDKKLLSPSSLSPSSLSSSTANTSSKSSPQSDNAESRRSSSLYEYLANKMGNMDLVR